VTEDPGASAISSRPLLPEDLTKLGVDPTAAVELARAVNRCFAEPDPLEAWRRVSTEVLRPGDPFELHEHLFRRTFRGWGPENGPPPAWIPTERDIRSTNLALFMESRRFDRYEDLHRWSVSDREAFWAAAIERLGIRFRVPYRRVLDLSAGVERPRWLPGARLNIAESCFGSDPGAPAIVEHGVQGGVRRISLAELDALSNRVATGLLERGLRPGDAVGICMPMSVEAVAAYLGIVKSGSVAVSVADTFAAAEVARRLRAGRAKIVFTQDAIVREEKRTILYERLRAEGVPPAVVLPAEESRVLELDPQDRVWSDFLSSRDRFEARPCDPHDHLHILFSSGTTASPKAIPWTHTTPIRCATDGHFHHDLKPGDVVAWPTNLGWMMGPWLVFAS